MIKPWTVDELGMAFGQTGEGLPTERECYNMKNAGEIKREYINLVGDWFFNGLTKFTPVPRPGVDVTAAMKCIRAELTSWERSHQHKEMIVAWLIDQWFESVEWEVATRHES